MFDWHLANLEYANAARVGNLSLRHWDQDDMWEMPGQHSFLPGGNGQLVEALAKGLNILYRHEVTAIEIAHTGASLTARNLGWRSFSKRCAQIAQTSCRSLITTLYSAT